MSRSGTGVELIREVRTPQGEYFYHLPIGTPLTAAMQEAAEARSAQRAHDTASASAKAKMHLEEITEENIHRHLAMGHGQGTVQGDARDLLRAHNLMHHGGYGAAASHTHVTSFRPGTPEYEAYAAKRAARDARTAVTGSGAQPFSPEHHWSTTPWQTLEHFEQRRSRRRG